MFATGQRMKPAIAHTHRSETEVSPIPDAHSSAPAPEDVSSEDEAPVATNNWVRLVDRIQQGDESAMTELYGIFSKGIRYYLCRQLGAQELDDKVHDTFLIVVQAIQRGELREPERLMGFVRTIVRRQVAAYIGSAVHARRDMVDLEAGSSVADISANPEQTAMDRQTVDLMKRVLGSVSHRDREILTRFYLLEQTQEKICHDMDLSETQFRLLKSRAKARFGELGKKRLTPGLPGLLMRKTANASY